VRAEFIFKDWQIKTLDLPEPMPVVRVPIYPAHFTLSPDPPGTRPIDFIELKRVPGIRSLVYVE
jgi:hypothetical protein